MADDFFSSPGGNAGHTVIPPTRRPDGSLRKPIRVRAGYVPQDEVAAWESPARRMQREREQESVPVGWDPAPVASRSSSKVVGGEDVYSSSSAQKMSKTQKRNLARKKKREEKRQQQPEEEAVQKKLQRVAQLQAKVDAGEVTPTDEQRQELKKRAQFEKELADLQAAFAKLK